MMGIRCDYSDARDCSECNKPICLRYKYRQGDRADEPDHDEDKEG